MFRSSFNLSSFHCGRRNFIYSNQHKHRLIHTSSITRSNKEETVIGNEKTDESLGSFTTLRFVIPNVTGSLFRILESFKTHNVSLHRLNSRAPRNAKDVIVTCQFEGFFERNS